MRFCPTCSQALPTATSSTHHTFLKKYSFSHRLSTASVWDRAADTSLELPWWKSYRTESLPHLLVPKPCCETLPDCTLPRQVPAPSWPLFPHPELQELFRLWHPSGRQGNEALTWSKVVSWPVLISWLLRLGWKKGILIIWNSEHLQMGPDPEIQFNL